MAKVILAPEAIEDILGIYEYILDHDGMEQAEEILQKLEMKVHSLAKLALRGKFPDDLVPFGNTQIREVQEKPWRIFYRPENEEVLVLAVLDGRRVMAGLLLGRLVG